MRAELPARIASAHLSGTLDIANSLHKAFILEFAAHELVEVSGFAILDSCADVDTVASSLVVKLEKLGLLTRQKLPRPFSLGSWDREVVETVTHFVDLPVRIGEHFATHPFGVTNMPTPPHIICGRPWLKKHCPHALEILDNFGAGEASTPDSGTHATRKVTFTHSPDLSPEKLPGSGTISPIALGPSKDPSAAFSAGGVFSALEAEEARRKDIQERHLTCMTLRAHVSYVLDDKQETARIRSTSADPGVRGLTGNAAGWLDSIHPAFRSYADSVFSDQSAAQLPPHRPGTDCTIKVRDGETLSTSKIYDMSQEQLTVLKQLLDAELAKGFIRPSKSESSAPVFFVRDPPSESRNQGQLRLVVDYRDLNGKIELDEYPIPLSRTVMARLPKAKIFTKFDVRSGFSNIRMAPGSEAATAFKTFYGLFEYQVLPMGLATAPSVFQRFINKVLSPYLDLFCFAYLDDIIIFSDSEEQHQEHVRLVLEALKRNQLHLKPSKCVWFTQEVSFLGFTAVAGKGIRMSDDKIQALRNLPAPRGLADLRSFLGMVNFYDKFIPHYSDIVAPLTDLTKKDRPWSWEATHESAFARLLSAIRNDVFLAAFDPDKPITMETDASDVAYGIALSQPDDQGTLRPFLFAHHKFKDAEKNWDAADKELYAIVFAFHHFRHFLAAPRFPVAVFSDHRNLAKFMFSTDLLKSHDGRLGRWWQQLSECNFRIEYRTGATNVVADFLSRYGYEDSAALDAKCLLPAARFSDKALADVLSWFKTKETTPNIRQKLETRFSNGDSKPETKNQIGSVNPVSPRSLVCRLTADHAARPLFRMIARLVGPTSDSLGAPPHACRSGTNRLGLGAS